MRYRYAGNKLYRKEDILAMEDFKGDKVYGFEDINW